jgi:S-adenosylmethionine:tRNA ribosyltransferase-isomerase
MNVSDYNYQLPPELIAQFPPAKRTDSRLLVMNSNGDLDDRQLPHIVDQLTAGDLLVLNDTKVIPARLFGRKETGGKVEVLLERISGDRQLLAQIRSSKAPRISQILFVDGDSAARLTVTGRQDNFFELSADVDGDLCDWFEKVGHMPLPPYIERADLQEDQSRYQTVFAQHQGAVAAPTAGLHYDQALLDRIKAKGINIETITLHVGAGTYQPVRVDTIAKHKMHSERIQVSEQVCQSILATKASGSRIIAVGTTVVRSLESAARQSTKALIEPYSGETDIFIYPGFDFKVVDVLQTNFHLPQSTLLMLVSAFSGKEKVMNAYQHAIEQQYRFFSYGDAMLLHRNCTAD